MSVKEESDWLKTQHSKTKIMTSGPITFWQIEGIKVEGVIDFISLGSKITSGGDCSHEMKSRLLLERKAMTNLDSVITLPTKVRVVKAMVFPVVVYGCKSLTIKKSERFPTVVLEKTFDSLLDGKEIKPVNPKGNQP